MVLKPKALVQHRRDRSGRAQTRAESRTIRERGAGAAAARPGAPGHALLGTAVPDWGMASAAAPEPPGNSAAGPNLNNNNNHQQQREEPPPGVRKCGYLRKHKHGHKRFFVLRAPGAGAGGEEASLQPARLEYYESEKKWRSKSPAPKRTIALDSCLHIHKRADARHKHLIALYTRDEYFALAAQSEQEQEGWYQAMAELLRESPAAGRPSQRASCEDFGCGQPGSGTPGSAAAAAYREVWQVTLKPRGLGQNRRLAGVHRLCLAARTVGLVRLNCERPCVTLQLMNIRRCGHSDSFFFMELGRSASIGPGELWMQADDSVVAQNIHETILEAMKALRELAEFRPRSKSQSSSSSSSSGGATAVASAGGGGGGPSSMCSRPISVPGRRLHHPLAALPPGQAGLLRRSRTDILAVTGSSCSSRTRTASEGDGFKMASLPGSPLSPEAGQIPLSRAHALGTACCRIGEQTVLQPGCSLAFRQSPSSVSTRFAMEPGVISRCPSSCSASASGSPSDPAGFVTLEDLGSSPAGDPRPLSSSLTGSNTPETPPGWQLDGYIAVDQGCLCYRPYLCETTGGDKVPRKRTNSLTTPAHRCPLLPPLSSASLDEYTLMRAALATAGPSPKAACVPYPEDYCDVDIGSGGTSSSSTSYLGHSGANEEGYVSMSPRMVSVLPLQGGHDGYMSMSPTSVSAPWQILHPRPYRINSGSSPDDSSYMPMWGAGAKRSGENPDGGLATGDYINMSPLLFPPSSGPSPAATHLLSADVFSTLGPGDQSGYFCHPSHVCWSQPNSLGEKKDQYVLLHSPAGKLNHTPKEESFLATCNHTTMPLPIHHSHTESSLNRRRVDSAQTSHLPLGLLLPSMNEPLLPNEPQSPSGEYVNIGYSLAPTDDGSPSLHGSGLGGHNSSLISNYMNLNFDGSHSGVIPVGSLEEVFLPGSCPSPGHPDKHYVQVGKHVASLSSPSSEPEIFLTTATVPPQSISHKPESACVTIPVAGLKRLTLSGVEAFTFASPPPDPSHGAKVIRADPQGRRRHSSETFLSTTTVTPVSPSFAHNSKQHNSASVENVSLRKNASLVEEQNSSPMCRETSAGFQNGLNYIAVDVLDGDQLAYGGQRKHKGRHPLNGSINGTYTSIDFLAHNLKEVSLLKE